MRRILRHRAPASLAILGVALLARGAHAQPTTDSTPPRSSAASAMRTDPVCWRGRPLPRCRAFVLFELGGYAALASTGVTVANAPTQLEPNARQRRTAFNHQLSWSVGAMRNLDASTALGGAAIVGFGDQGLVAATVRARRWTGRLTSVEAAAGPMTAQLPVPVFEPSFSYLTQRWQPGALAEARVNVGDLGALSVRGVIAPRRTAGTQGALFAGASLGSTPAAITTGVLGVLTAILIGALLRSGFD